ncbi:MAG: uncharacterized protein A8A55_2223 [Amphiamblys sp. WSBS2006]|nr:MAG: uncharacterized protein A8A55_2223 [Amphiamblys sp. WSBS2006]
MKIEVADVVFSCDVPVRHDASDEERDAYKKMCGDWADYLSEFLGLFYAGLTKGPHVTACHYNKYTKSVCLSPEGRGWAPNKEKHTYDGALPYVGAFIGADVCVKSVNAFMVPHTCGQSRCITVVASGSLSNQKQGLVQRSFMQTLVLKPTARNCYTILSDTMLFSVAEFEESSTEEENDTIETAVIENFAEEKVGGEKPSDSGNPDTTPDDGEERPEDDEDDDAKEEERPEDDAKEEESQSAGDDEDGDGEDGDGDKKEPSEEDKADATDWLTIMGDKFENEGLAKYKSDLLYEICIALRTCPVGRVLQKYSCGFLWEIISDYDLGLDKKVEEEVELEIYQMINDNREDRNDPRWLPPCILARFPPGHFDADWCYPPFSPGDRIVFKPNPEATLKMSTKAEFMLFPPVFREAVRTEGESVKRPEIVSCWEGEKTMAQILQEKAKKDGAETPVQEKRAWTAAPRNNPPQRESQRPGFFINVRNYCKQSLKAELVRFGGTLENFDSSRGGSVSGWFADTSKTEELLRKGTIFASGTSYAVRVLFNRSPIQRASVQPTSAQPTSRPDEEHRRPERPAGGNGSSPPRGRWQRGRN